jgi:hypothetical protein
MGFSVSSSLFSSKYANIWRKLSNESFLTSNQVRSMRTLFVDLSKLSEMLDRCWISPSPKICSMFYSPMGNDHSLNAVVLLAIITSHPTWPTKLLDCLHEESKDCIWRLVRATFKIDNHARMSINTAMNPETPWSKSHWHLDAREHGTSNFIHSAPDYSSPSERVRDRAE